MEAILKFNLPEEAPEFKLAIFGSKYYNALFEFDQLLKNFQKNGHEKTVEEIRDCLWELLKDENIDLHIGGL